MDNEELLAYCEMLENIVMERGINADFMWKAKRALEKLTRIEDIFHADFEWWNDDAVYHALRTVFEEVADAE